MSFQFLSTHKVNNRQLLYTSKKINIRCFIKSLNLKSFPIPFELLKIHILPFTSSIFEQRYSIASLQVSGIMKLFAIFFMSTFTILLICIVQSTRIERPPIPFRQWPLKSLQECFDSCSEEDDELFDDIRECYILENNDEPASPCVMKCLHRRCKFIIPYFVSLSDFCTDLNRWLFFR